MILVLQLGLGALGTGSNGLRIVAVEGAAGLGMIELRAVLIVAGDQQGNTKGARHDGLLAVGTLAEAQGEVADGLGGALDTEGLGVVECVGLGLDTGVLDHGAGIGLEARHGAADMAVDFDNLLDGGGLKEGGSDTLLDTEDNTLRGCDTDGCAAELDSFEGVFDLEEATFWGEGVDATVWDSMLEEAAPGALIDDDLPYSDLAINILTVLVDLCPKLRISGYKRTSVLH